jgi:Mg-chelatase subunit ChlD
MKTSIFLLLVLSAIADDFRKENLDLPYNAKGENEDENTAETVLVFWGHEYAGDTFVLVLDSSGSMATGAKMQALKREANKSVTDLNTNAEFGLLAFNVELKVWSEKTKDASIPNKESARGFIAGLVPKNSTNVSKAVIKALEIAKTSSKKSRQIIVQCDGLPTTEKPDEALQKIHQANTERYKIHAVLINGNGNEAAREFMQTLARQNSGTFREVSL